MFNQLQRLLLMTSALLVLVAQTAGAEVNPEGTDTKATENVIALNEQSNSEVKIPQLDESDRPATTLKEWLSQSANQETGDRPLAQSPVQVTGVRLNQTDSGLEVILETPNVEKLQPPTRSEGNRYIADIENAQLLLPNGNSFRQANPVKGITEVTVSSFAPNSIRVTVTGTSAVPKVELFDSEEGLILGVTPAASSTQAEQTPQTPQAEQTESETQPKEPSAEGEKPIEILVTGAQEEGYVVPDASTGTKFEAPIRDIPQSIQVVPQQVLEDQGVTQLIDALRNVSSISSGSFSGDYFESISIRGFSDFSNFFTDGFRNVSSGASVLIDRANVERIEVLKGPASVLYGQGEPGGIINLVTKQPLPEPYYALEGTIGNFDFYRPALDISGPLDADRTALYRLNVAYQNSGSFVDFLDTERLFIAPVFSFQVGRNTTLVLEGSYQDNFRSDYQGVPAVGSVLSNPLGRVPRSRNLGDPDIDGISNVVGNVSYRLEHKFSDNWSIRNAFRVESYRIKEVEQIFITGLEIDNRTVNRQAYQATGYRDNFTLQTDVIGKIQTGTVKQDLLLGFELRRLNQDFQTYDPIGDTPSIDLFDPDYGGLPQFDFEKTYDAFQENNFIGVYAQDLISIGDIKILLGGRFDWVEQKYDGRLEGESFLVQDDSAFSPRIGIVYQPIQPISLYASYSRSFFPEGDFGTRNADGTPFEPTKGEQLEVGVKTEFLDGRLSAILAAYDITKQNTITDDPDRPGFSIQIGEQRSRGIEFDLIGEPLPGLRLIASYAYIDAEITEDNSGNEGNQPNNVPRHSGSLWAVYEIQEGDLQGLGFGAGVFVVGDREGDLGNTFELPGYARTDALLYYRRDNWRVQLNVKNLFDVNYFESASGSNQVRFGEPFTIQGTVSVTF